MTATINQKVIFQNTTTKKVYALYMNTKKHAMISGGSVKVSEKPGSKLEVFDGYITGETLLTIKNELIVQQWRGSDWKKSASHSVLVIALQQKGKQVILNVTHSNIPADKSADLNKGWHEFYWDRYKKHLSK